MSTKPNIAAVAPVTEEPSTAQPPSVKMSLAVSIRWIALIVVPSLLLIFLGTYVTGRVIGHVFREQSAVVESIRVEVQTGMASVNDSLSEKHEIDRIYFKILYLKPQIDYLFAHRLATIIYRESKLQDRDPNFVISLIRIESNFEPNAKSPVGAEGLTQIMPAWKPVLKIEGDLTDPEVAIKYGIQIYTFYEKMYSGDTNIALSAYNQGPVIVNAAIRTGQSPMSNGYATRIRKFQAMLKMMDRASGGLGP